MPDIRVLLSITPHNRGSMAALAGALEETPASASVPVVLAKTPAALLAAVSQACGGLGLTVVALSFTTPRLLDAARTLLAVRREAPAAPGAPVVLVAGGPHASALPEETLRLGVDYVVNGEGEVAFPALIAALAGGRDPLAVPGVSALRDGRFCDGGRAAPAELDRHPPLSRRSSLFAYLELTRGCPCACRFCQATFLFGGRFRHRSVERILDAVRFLVTRGRRDIRFVTPDAFSYGSDRPGAPDLVALRSLLRQVSAAASGRRVYFGSFPSEVWPGSVTEPALALVREYAANDNLVVGLQSGSQRVLDAMHRGHSVEQGVRAVDLILKAGFTANVDFLFGFPGETPADEAATLDLMRALTDRGARIHSHTFLPLPGTPLAEAEPAALSPRLIRMLDHLAGTGRQFGSWRRQRAAAAQVRRFRDAIRRGSDVAAALAAADDSDGHAIPDDTDSEDPPPPSQVEGE